MRIDQRGAAEGSVWAGVDTHAGTNWLSVVDPAGRELFSGEFATDAAGRAALCDKLEGLGPVAAAGVECTGSYGAGIARDLAARGVACYEVVTPGRPPRGRGCGKDDAGDALRAARQALSGEGLAVPKSQDGWVEECRSLLAAREGLVRSCTSLSNLALSIVRKAPDEVRGRLERLGTAKMMGALAEWEGASGDPVCDAAMLALASLGKSWAQARRSAEELERRIAETVGRGNPALASMHGCGPVSAAALAVAAGDNPGRLRSEAAFAALCGASPIRASSGKVERHRLNRGGDRRANRALHTIALQRMRTDPRTMRYVERRRAEGMSDREIRRCLKRYIAREAYRLIMDPGGAPDRGEGPGLRAARVSAGISQRDAAAALGVSASTLSGLERGRRRSGELARRYRQWVDDGFPVDAEVSS